MACQSVSWLRPASVNLLLLLPAVLTFARPAIDRPPGDDEVRYSPADGAVTSVNPPPFVWLPLEGVETWHLQVSRSPDFPEEGTITVRDWDLTVYVPRHPMPPGDWYWRYGYSMGGETRFGRARPFAIAEDATILPFPPVEQVLERVPVQRPRLYFPPEDLAEIRAEPQGRFREIVEPVVRAAEEALAMEEELFPEPPPWEEFGEKMREEYQRIFVAMRPYTERMHMSAMAYLFTGDRRFGEEARRRLMHFMTWDVEGPSSVIWPSELGMDIAERAPRAFDWIYDILTEEERALCVEVLGLRIAQINRLHRSMPFESRPFRSHPGRMIGFAIEGSLALAHELPEAADWLEYTLRLLWSVYPAWGGEEGGWHEGIGYWNSYMGRIMNVVIELDRLGVPIKERPFFQNTGWFGFYVAYPGRRQRGFGDGFEGGISGGFGHNLYRFSTLYQNPWFRWSANRIGGRPHGPVAVQVFDPDLEEKSPAGLPHSRLFSDVGLVAMHGELDNPEDNVILLLQSSPFGSVSHNHANQNAFTIDAFGEPLAISSGFYQAYGRGHHSEWIWQTKAHNSVLVNGEGQTPRSRRAVGKITAYQENGDWAYAAGDATAAYDGRLGKFVRHVVFLRPDTFVMIDDLEGPGEPARFQWLLHSRSEMELDEPRRTVGVSQGNARMRVRFLEPEALSFAQTSGWDPEPPRPERAPPQFHFTASTREAREATRFVTVLQPYRAGDGGRLPEPRLRDAEGGLAVVVGDRLVLWKDPAAAEVRSGAVSSREPVAVIRAGAPP